MSLWHELPDRLIIIAHRGASATAPENTIAAFEEAIAARADAIELDVQLTADEKVAVIHDYRLERTTNGKGEVGNTSASLLRSYSAGAWFHHTFTTERVPLLDDVLDLVRGKALLNIELKQKGRTPDTALLQETIRLIKRQRAEKFVLLSSFNHDLIRLVPRYNDTLATAILSFPLRKFSRSPVQQTENARAQFYFCSRRALRKKTIKKLHEKGKITGIYTVSSEKDVAKAIRFGVDCIFTDSPALVVRLTSQKIPHLGD